MQSAIENVLKEEGKGMKFKKLLRLVQKALGKEKNITLDGLKQECEDMEHVITEGAWSSWSEVPTGKETKKRKPDEHKEPITKKPKTEKTENQEDQKIDKSPQQQNPSKKPPAPNRVFVCGLDRSSRWQAISSLCVCGVQFTGDLSFRTLRTPSETSLAQ